MMATTIVSLLLAGTAFIIIDRQSTQNSLLDQIFTLNRIIADRSTAALTFNDKNGAEEILSALKQESIILISCIYTQSKDLFATYKNSQSISCTKSVEDQFDNDYLKVYQPIVLENEKIGTVYIVANLKPLTEHNLWFVLVVFIIVVVVSLFIFPLVNQQQNIYTTTHVRAGRSIERYFQ